MANITETPWAMQFKSKLVDLGIRDAARPLHKLVSETLSDCAPSGGFVRPIRVTLTRIAGTTGAILTVTFVIEK